MQQIETKIGGRGVPRLSQTIHNKQGIWGVKGNAHTESTRPRWITGFILPKILAYSRPRDDQYSFTSSKSRYGYFIFEPYFDYSHPKDHES